MAIPMTVRTIGDLAAIAMAIASLFLSARSRRLVTGIIAEQSAVLMQAMDAAEVRIEYIKRQARLINDLLDDLDTVALAADTTGDPEYIARYARERAFMQRERLKVLFFSTKESDNDALQTETAEKPAGGVPDVQTP
jgi:hypothetical protein